MTATSPVVTGRPQAQNRRGAAFGFAVVGLGGGVGAVVAVLLTLLLVVGPAWNDTATGEWPGAGRDVSFVVVMFVIPFSLPLGIVHGCVTGAVALGVHCLSGAERHLLRVPLVVVATGLCAGGGCALVVAVAAGGDTSEWGLIALTVALLAGGLAALFELVTGRAAPLTPTGA